MSVAVRGHAHITNQHSAENLLGGVFAQGVNATWFFVQKKGLPRMKMGAWWWPATNTCFPTPRPGAGPDFIRVVLVLGCHFRFGNQCLHVSQTKSCNQFLHSDNLGYQYCRDGPRNKLAPPIFDSISSLVVSSPRMSSPPFSNCPPATLTDHPFWYRTGDEVGMITNPGLNTIVAHVTAIRSTCSRLFPYLFHKLLVRTLEEVALEIRTTATRQLRSTQSTQSTKTNSGIPSAHPFLIPA